MATASRPLPGADWAVTEERAVVGRIGFRNVDLFEGEAEVAHRHSTRNPASCRVAERSGYELEGTMRRAGRHADGDHDMHLHSRTIPG